MDELILVIDCSGSMCTSGKINIIGSILQTLSALNKFDDTAKNISATRMPWDGNRESFELLSEKCSGKKTLILTDGYAFLDNCRESQIAKKFFETNRENVFVVLCGGDAFDISALSGFKRVPVTRSDNILFAFDSLYKSAETEKENWE